MTAEQQLHHILFPLFRSIAAAKRLDLKLVQTYLEAYLEVLSLIMILEHDHNVVGF